MAKFIELTERGEKFTRLQEGTIRHVYDDGVPGGKMWRKGTKLRGRLTAGTGHLLNDAEIAQWAGKAIPEDVIARWFDEDTDIAESNVARVVKVPLKSNQRDVLIDVAFNVGNGAFNKSTILKRVNAKEYDRVPEQLLRWTKATVDDKMVTLPGLVKRANDRVAYWNAPEFSAAPHDDGESGTPIAEPTPIKTSPMEWASLAVGGLSGLSGFSGVAGFFGVAIGVAVLVATGVGAFIVIRRVLDPK